MSDAVSPPPVAKSDGAISDFWTDAMKARAQPTPMPVLDKTKYRPGRAVPEPDENYPVTFVPRDISALPYSAVCKVFYTNNDQPFVASGWIVKGNTGVKGIITAAHVLFSRGVWSQKFLVQRAYTNGSYAEQWESDYPIAMRGWTDSGDPYWDMGAIVPKVPIGDKTPAFETVYGMPYSQAPWNFYYGLGYPAEPANNYPFDGQLMWESDGPVLGASGHQDRIMLQAANAMERGSSGGPWLNYDPNSRTFYANGIQSHGDPGRQAPYSPHFATNNIVPLLVHINVLRF